jgi:SAM-dependent methyltransferase
MTTRGNDESSPVEDVADYYAARAFEYDKTAGYEDPVAERLRDPIKRRYQSAFAGHDVLEIACGTGYWTEVIAGTARSVLATDINPEVISIAGRRLRGANNVRFIVADAYSLDGVPDGFTAAFAVWWWSHVPRSRIAGFLSTLHAKLRPTAFVLFADQLEYGASNRHRNAEGDLLEERTLADGRRFRVVKNFPTEHEIRAALAGVSEDVRYTEYPDERNWNVSYRVKKRVGQVR